MESIASKERAAKEQREELKRQIAALQAQLPQSDPEDSDTPSRVPGPSSPKRRKLDPVLVPSTPSPKKRRPDAKIASSQSSRNALKSLNTGSGTLAKPVEEFVPVKPAASNLLSKLASSNRRPLDVTEAEPLVRSSAFTDAPQAPDPSTSVPTVLQRDERLALIENLEFGPVDHKPPFDDPHFQQLEPNSGIRLSSRIVPHEDLQDHLRGRYYLSPSRLYSAVRLLPDKQGYDVPVAGDWVTIAVVAERGPFKYSKAPVGITPDEETDRRGKAKEPPKPSGKKYINMKLVDFGAPARSASSATGGKAVIRGDALLSLLLFESDGFEMVPQDEGRPKKVYRGGSRGAFEEMCDVKEGDVIALLNPRVLKPFQRANDKPHPTTNILAITPESASSVMVIGRAKDLGLCGAVKRDGKVCGSWCDRRLSDVCEWHVQYAVEQRRASRPEFSVGTSGLSTTAVRKRRPDYDPRRKWGLKPLDEVSAGATYLVSGHIISGSAGTDLRDSMHIGERIGREGQAKASRKLAGREDERMLKALMGRDSEGMKTVMKAREVGLAEKAEAAAAAKPSKGKGKKKAGAADGPTATPAQDGAAPKAPGKNAYSAEVVKQLGFDPTVKAGHRRYEDSVMKKKLADLASVQSSRKTIALGPPPGDKVRSGVVAPGAALKSKPKAKPKRPFDLTHMHSDDDDDMPAAISLPKAAPPEEKMVDLDDW
ncbi:hypothetical protein B0H17DRAFT_1167798 [Mycena rosella]|uniref:Zinc finger Mcm10/DnaG-type domain-containing protein n=1 Tax=Mycena rosella TaxID=1033263 RepID=A0AAD7DTJ0_MYCRO|nr:hypothetical protein B0H17DRAFT_1167798 [Mycena rosella]